MSLVEVVVVVDVDMDVVVVVVVAVYTIASLPTMRDHSPTVGILGGLVRGMAMVDLMDLTVVAVVVVAVVVSVMEKLVIWNALEGYLNAIRKLGVGEYFLNTLF